MKIQKPFLKWVGGKSQLINTLITILKEVICDNYHEIFLGGGSVLLAILSLKREGFITIHKDIYAYDYNIHLINLFKTIQTNLHTFYPVLKEYKDNFDLCPDKNVYKIKRKSPKPETLDEATLSKEHYYYWLRNKFNNTTDIVHKSALFLLLNKTCFRGVYRENPKTGHFNVPYGNYKTYCIPSLEELEEISELIKDVHFIHESYTTSILNISEGDFAYFDPPYAPINEKSFTGYTASGFTLDDHTGLFEMIGNLKNKYILSNADVPLVREYFSDDKYNIQVVSCKRSIHSKNPGNKADEVLITYN